jgi:hypothetical protein
MKKLLLILLCLPIIGFGQQTYVPDDNFETYLEANGMGNGIANDDYVTTSNINTVTFLDVGNQNIADLTGIENFTALIDLKCGDNSLTSLDVSQNTDLISLDCDRNQITSLDVSNNLLLERLYCDDNQITNLDITNNTALIDLYFSTNQLTSLDLSNNTALDYLYLRNNQLTSLDVSLNTALTWLDCGDNQLTSLDVSNNVILNILYCFNNYITTLDISAAISLTHLKCENNKLINLDVRNGNNTNIMNANFTAYGNPNLYCINTDDAAWSTIYWTNIDTQSYFSTNCPPSAIQEHSTKKELFKVTDLLGRETKGTKNELLFYIYDDGTVDKKIIIE